MNLLDQITLNVLEIGGEKGPLFFMRHISHSDFILLKTISLMINQKLNRSIFSELDKVDSIFMSNDQLPLHEISKNISILTSANNIFLEEVRALISYQFSDHVKIAAKLCYENGHKCTFRNKRHCRFADDPKKDKKKTFISNGRYGNFIIDGCAVEWADKRFHIFEAISMYSESNLDSVPFLTAQAVNFLKYKRLEKSMSGKGGSDG